MKGFDRFIVKKDKVRFHSEKKKKNMKYEQLISPVKSEN